MKPPWRLDIGLLILRIALGLILIFHGSQKLFTGVFGGRGYAATMEDMTSHRIPPALAILAISAEFLGGLGVLVGFLTPLAALGIAATMAVGFAREVTTSGALKAFLESGDHTAAAVVLYPLILAMAALSLVVMGAGRYSLDARIFKRKGKAA